MYDMTKVSKRYFDLKLRNGKEINVEPPKMKILKKIASLSSISNGENLNDSDIDNLIEAVSLALSKNKQNYKIGVNQIADEYDIDDIVNILENYFEWVNNIQNSKN